MHHASCIMHRLFGLALLLGAAVGAGAGNAAEVGPAADVAPQVKDSVRQAWPAAAWCEGSRTWLVAWREGCLNEDASDIWCARVSAEGKALDPDGIKVCGAKDTQDHPKVASDGKGFLVVWEDFRNGKDYDVYAARVSADGKVLDPDGVLVAGGENNQARPTTAFAGGNYLVAWQGFSGDGLDGDGKTGYRVCGARVSPEGKPLDQARGPERGNRAEGVLDAGGTVWVDFPRAGYEVVNPVLVPAGDKALLLVQSARNAYGPNCVTMVSGADGKVAGKPAALASDHKEKAGRVGPVAASWSGAGGVAVGAGGEFTAVAWPVSAAGAGGGPEKLQRINMLEPHLLPQFSLAFDGERHLLVAEDTAKDKVRVMGLYLSADGKVEGAKGDKEIAARMFVIGEGKHNCLQGVACAGPKGCCLVVCADVRGLDDMKLVARIVK
jgi:hypothetical protein